MSGVQRLNFVWDLIKETLGRGLNKKNILKTITLAAKYYNPEYFVVGKRLGDESQALACLRDLKIVTYGKNKETLNSRSAERNALCQCFCHI